MVSLAIVRIGASSGKSAAAFSEELQEAVLQGLIARLDRIEPAAHAYYLLDHVRDTLAGQAAEDDPFAVVAQLAKRSQGCALPGIQAGDPEAASAAAEQLIERARRDHSSLVDHRDPVADHLDLGQQVGVQEHGRPALA